MNLIDLKIVVKYLLASILIGVVLGISGAFAAQGFRSGIVVVTKYLEFFFSNQPNFLFFVITLSIALVFVHFSKVLIKGKPFQSVSDSIYLAHKYNNETNVKIGIVSTIAAFFSASGGASIGQYGPLVHFGTTLGAWLKKKIPFNFTPDLYIGAGVAAAISSGFGAPLAGLIFAHEAILRHYSHKSVLAIATASGVSYGISTAIWGDTNIINVSSDEFNFLLILIVSFLAGPVFGFVSILYMRSLLFFAKMARVIKGRLFYKYAFGIISLSLIGHYVPEVMGLGSETVADVLISKNTVMMLIVILIAKILATSISLNFGFFGGVFSPAILIGASAGALISAILVFLGVFDQFQQALVVSGIAAVAGAVIGAPICMVVIVLELTNSYSFAFNMQFDFDEDIKGDLEVHASGTESLMANEVRSQRLMQFLQVAQNPVLAPFAKMDYIIREIAKAMDLDPDKITNSLQDAAVQAEILKKFQQPAPAPTPQVPEEGGQGQPQPEVAGASPADTSGAGGGTIGTGIAPAPNEQGVTGNNAA